MLTEVACFIFPFFGRLLEGFKMSNRQVLWLLEIFAWYICAQNSWRTTVKKSKSGSQLRRILLERTS